MYNREICKYLESRYNRTQDVKHSVCRTVLLDFIFQVSFKGNTPIKYLFHSYKLLSSLWGED